MDTFFGKRQNFLTLVFLVLIIILIVRLFFLTVVQKQTWMDAAANLSTKTVYTPAPRGEIKDRNGKLLAGNHTQFAVNLIAADIDKGSLNDLGLRLLNLLEANGDSYNDSLPIAVDEEGNYYYTYKKDVEEWLASQDLSTSLTAREAFDSLRERQGIDPSLSDYDAQTMLQTVYSIYPPISVVRMEFTSIMELNSFLESVGIEDMDMPAEEAFRFLRDKYGIDESLSDEDARKILIVRDALKNLGYKSYMPAEIASDVSQQTVIMLEEDSDNFPGVSVDRKYLRYYPYGSSASHILGYLGKISESEKEEYLNKGYSTTDIIGKEGIESYYESALRGISGERVIEVNSQGEQVAELSSSESQPGHDVTLTIDMDLQAVAESSLEQAVKEISRGGYFSGKYGSYNYGTAYRNANVGAVVAVDVKSGEILALANYPSYDPNLFATGISSEDWDSLQSENPNDPISPRPLYNVATMTSVQPGSTFKPVVALTALDKGWNPNAYLYTAGVIKLGNQTFGCWLYNDYGGGRHGSINLLTAIEVSCNYFFYDLGSGFDFAANRKLSIDIDIQDVMNYAENLGLGQHSGIELAESAVGVPSEEKKIASIKSQLRYYLRMNAEKYFEPSLTGDLDRLNQTLDQIVSWSDEDLSQADLVARFREMEVKQDEVNTLAFEVRSTYYNQAQWGIGDSLNLSIGQGENAYTPVQMARYVAAVANDGVRYDLTLTKSIEGSEIEQNEGVLIENSNANAYQIVRNGMERVAHGSRGSARANFLNFEYRVGCKTGTAQKSGKINTPDEVGYIKSHLSGIAPGLTFEEVENEMRRLMREDPETFKSESTAIRRAVMNLSGVSADRIDMYKPSYENFAWFVCFAPVDDPQIAISCLIFQGGTGSYCAPVAREIIGKYMEMKKNSEQQE